MKRFDDLDLSQLPPPDFPEPLSFEAVKAERLADLQARFAAAGIAYDVAQLESDPSVMLQETDGYREVVVRGRLNDAVRAVLVSTATGADLDNAVADFGLVRKLVTPANPVTGAPDVMETDEALRRRRLLAVEALSSAGPEGAYVFHALAAHPHVGDVAVYGPEAEIEDPENPGLYLTGDGKVLVVILSNQEDAVPTGQVTDAVSTRLWHPDIRPLTDFVAVRAAAATEYAVALTLSVPEGPDAEAVRLAAQDRIERLTAALRAVGAGVTRNLLEAAATVFGTDGSPLVVGIDLVSPAADVDADPLAAPVCTAIVVGVEVAT